MAHLIGTLLVSEWMACGLVGLGRFAYRCLLQADMMVVSDRALGDWLRGYAKKHPRGYRCVYHRRPW
ncbi:MAG: hypothetical protein B5766_01410 [Candidatus Lumbricidophila eiseniae]|uniref:Uncharacterized protein n=1 Tax=Candidatus Lumbricidiphila eiseniae TaxID=1969409 RepID=A0A2A6FUR1_9MICO|nr:MAG: hypothetical protein B5766_01410 [Candidatus Lumbricidophila eiseniae]